MGVSWKNRWLPGVTDVVAPRPWWMRTEPEWRFNGLR